MIKRCSCHHRRGGSTRDSLLLLSSCVPLLLLAAPTHTAHTHQRTTAAAQPTRTRTPLRCCLPFTPSLAPLSLSLSLCPCLSLSLALQHLESPRPAGRSRSTSPGREGRRGAVATRTPHRLKPHTPHPGPLAEQAGWVRGGGEKLDERSVCFASTQMFLSKLVTNELLITCLSPSRVIIICRVYCLRCLFYHTGRTCRLVVVGG